MKVYYDGVSQTLTTQTNALTGSILNNTTPEIGRRGTNWPFNGLIDDVRIYNRALSPDEIRRLYNIGR